MPHNSHSTLVEGASSAGLCALDLFAGTQAKCILMARARREGGRDGCPDGASDTTMERAPTVQCSCFVHNQVIASQQ